MSETERILLAFCEFRFSKKTFCNYSFKSFNSPESYLESFLDEKLAKYNIFIGTWKEYGLANHPCKDSLLQNICLCIILRIEFLTILVQPDFTQTQYSRQVLVYFKAFKSFNNINSELQFQG